MSIKDFKVELWLNPLDPLCKYNLGASCVKAVSIDELMHLVGEDSEKLLSEFGEMRMHYGFFEGNPRLKRAIAGLYKDASEDMVSTHHGGTGANSAVLNALVEKGDNVVAFIPNYQQHYSIPESIGAEVRYLRLREENGYLPDLDELDKLVDDNTKMITFTNPNNPTGAYMDEQYLRKISEIAGKHNTYILSDEIYRGLADSYMPSIVDIYDKGISTASMSKVFSMAGTRVGWVVTRDENARKLIGTMRSYESICEAPIEEVLAAICLENHDIILRRSREIVGEGRAVLDKWLREHPHFSSSNKSYSSTALVRYDYDIDCVELCQDIFDKTGVLLCHGDCFEEEKCFRLGYGFGDIATLKKGFEELDKYFEKL